jgi:hypothetical protein
MRKLICEVVTSSRELFFSERARSVLFLKDLSNLKPFLSVRSKVLLGFMLILMAGPKVVINVRLMTEPLTSHDFEGDFVFDVEEGSYMTMFLNVDDESLTVTKFKTFQVRLLNLVRWPFSHFFFCNSTGL